jgi:hypothetical protein
MNKSDLDSGFKKAGAQAPRKSARVKIAATVKLGRRGHDNFSAKAFDFSREGCKLEFQERPRLDETVWVKFDDLELLEATVCWVDDLCVGVEFARPLHPAVFEMLAARFR